MSPGIAALKRALRAELLDGRRAAWGPAGEGPGAGGQRDGHVLAWAPTAAAAVIASYVSLRDEPGTVELNRELLARESRLLLPRLRMDGGLELVAWAGGPLRAGPRGTRVPDGPGVDPGEAELVIVPALAVDPATGVRLGRGGGAYDRLLAGLPSDRPVLALLAQPGELRPGLPAEPHDRRVTAVALPDGVLACGATG